MSTSDAEAISHRRVLTIAIPIVISNATVPILGAVDTGVVGQLGTAAPIGAVGLGAIILSSLFWIFGFLRMATTGLAAQAVGQADEIENRAILLRALAIGFGAGLLLILLQSPLFAVAFWAAPASAEVETLTREYVSIRMWSAPAAIAIYGITGWLIAKERTGAVLALQLMVNGVNVGLDFWFVLGLGWGVAGVAYGSLIAEWSGLILALWLCRGALTSVSQGLMQRVIDPIQIRRMGGVSTDILIRSLLLQVIFVSFLFFGAGLGDVTLAANQVLMQFVTITAYSLDGFAFSAEALVGQAVGARKVAHLRRASILSSLWAGGLMVLLAVVFVIFGTAFIDLLTTSEPVRAEAKNYLVWMILMPLVGIGPFMLDGIFIGATRTRDMRDMMALSTVIYGVALLCLLPLFANHGLWAAMLISFIARGVTLGMRYGRLEAGVRDQSPVPG